MSELLRQRGEGCLSDLTLDRMVIGELDERGEPGVHLVGCTECRARLAELRAESAAFDPAPFLAHGTPTPAPTLAPIVALPVRSPPAAKRRVPARRRWAVAATVTSLATAAVLGLWVRPIPGPGLRAKGQLQLELIARRANGVIEQVVSGGELAPGEAIRFRLSNRKPGYLSIVGLDSKPSVTAYHPDAGEALPIRAGRDRILDGSIILDETLGPERIVAALCAEPITVNEVATAAQRALDAAHGHPAQVGTLDVPCSQVSVLIVKTRRAGEPPAQSASGPPR